MSETVESFIIGKTLIQVIQEGICKFAIRWRQVNSNPDNWHYYAGELTFLPDANRRCLIILNELTEREKI